MLKVVDRFDLRCGVRFDAEPEILAVHARTIVDDANGAHAAVRNVNGNGVCAGVDCVVQELAHDGKRPVDYLAGRNLACDGIPQQVDPAAGWVIRHA